MSDEVLNSTVNTLEMRERVLEAARKKLRRRNINAFFEHGHWRVYVPDTDTYYDAVDAEGEGAVDGFDFEEV